MLIFIVLISLWLCFSSKTAATQFKDTQGEKPPTYLGQLQEFVQPLWSLRRLNNSRRRHNFNRVTPTLSGVCKCHILRLQRLPVGRLSSLSLHTFPHLRCYRILGGAYTRIQELRRMRGSGRSLLGRGECCLQVMSEVRQWQRQNIYCIVYIKWKTM